MFQLDLGLLQKKLFCKGKHRWLCAQKIYKLRQANLSKFVYSSLVLREQEETKNKYSECLRAGKTKKKTLNFTTKVTLCRIVIQQADDLLLCHSLFPGSCSVLANGTSLGAPDCKPHHNIYLKTVYTCIHKRHVHVLISKFDLDFIQTHFI